MSTKQTLREHLKQQRMALSGAQLANAGDACLRQLLALPAFSNAQKVGAYLDFRGEMSTQAVIAHLLANQQQVFLPVISKERLVYARHQNAADLAKNRYGILEPVASAARCDTGNRLGMGGGYYDKTLGSMQKKPLLIGLAHSFQELPSLIADPWDVPLNGIATERELILV